MGFRVQAPDCRKGADNLPILVLPDETVLKKIYTVKYLGAGGMSVSYSGFKNSERFFIKEVDGSDSKKVIALSQEKATLERLKHPGIVKVFDLFEEDGFYYLVTEFIEGTSLDRQISPLSGVFLQEKVLNDWASQLYDIFTYLHSQDPPIIFRDLKPQNVMKDREGKLHLVDFGIARVFKNYKDSDTLSMGTMLTASPEHYGGRQTDERSDIFTIGATLHYMATNGKGAGEELFEYPPVRLINGKLSQGFEAVLTKATEVEPSKRFQSVREMRDAHLGAGRHAFQSHDAAARPAKKGTGEPSSPDHRAAENGRSATMAFNTEAMVLQEQDTGESAHRKQGTVGDIQSVKVPVPYILMSALLVIILIGAYAVIKLTSRTPITDPVSKPQATVTLITQSSESPASSEGVPTEAPFPSVDVPSADITPSTESSWTAGGGSPHNTQPLQIIVTSPSAPQPSLPSALYPTSSPPQPGPLHSGDVAMPFTPLKHVPPGLPGINGATPGMPKEALEVPKNYQYSIGDTGATVRVPDGYLELVGVKAAEDDASFVAEFLKTGRNETVRGLQIRTTNPDPDRLRHFTSGPFIKNYSEKVLTEKKNMHVTESIRYSLNKTDGYLFNFKGYNNRMAMDTSCRQIVVIDRSGKTLIFLTAAAEVSSYSLYEKEFDAFFSSFRQ